MKRILFLASIFFLFCSAGFAAPNKIAQIEIEGDLSINHDEIFLLLPFQAGEKYKPAEVEMAREILEKWGIFDSVVVEAKQRADGVLIRIALEEAKLVCSIDLTGHYPHVETRIRKRMNLQVGDPYRESAIQEQIERIIRFFAQEGYPQTVVVPETHLVRGPNCLGVTLRIIKGDRLRYRKVIFEGVKSVRPGRLHTMLRHMALYSERRLKKSLEKITQYYKSKGFLRAKVNVASKEMDWEANRVDLKVEIKEGPRVKTFFEGEKGISKRKLRKTITLYKTGSYDFIELRLSAEALKKLYQETGYPDVKITFSKKKVGPDIYHVIFHIEPGQRRVVKEISFEGNESISDRKIKKQLLIREHSLTRRGALDEELMALDQQIITDFYYQNGFPDAQVSPATVTLNEKGNRYYLNYTIQEGQYIWIDRIDFDDENLPRRKLLRQFSNKERKGFNKPALEQDLQQVLIYYKNHGHPYATVEAEEIYDEDAVQLLIHSDPGPVVKIGEILFVGDILTGVRPMRQSLGIKEGDLYSEQEMLDAGLNLRRLGPFQAVNVEPFGLEKKEETIHVRVKVEEKKPFNVDFETRFSTDQQYSGTFKFTNLNSFGWAKTTRLTLTGGLEKNRAELAWLDPRFLGSDVQMDLAGWTDYEKRPFTTSIEAGGGLGFYRQFHRFGYLGRYELARIYSIAGQASDPASLRDSTLSAVTLSGSYDRRNNFSDPTKGFYTLQVARIVNEIGGAQANFAQLRTSTSQFYTPFKRFTFQSTFRLAKLQDIGERAIIPQKELLGLGGDDTVRGFKEDRAGPLDANGNPLGGRVRIIFNEELHFRLTPSFQTAFFYDIGSLTNTFEDLNRTSLRHSAGLGLRYITPVGPIRADYGFILDPGPTDNFGRLHITFGYPF
ncbi:MAG: POTRA domain-containing protein [Deltaproteobacteria bacterium]|nr:POTRA domain-containing protein [Deltaproteobacteria bacterium]